MRVLHNFLVASYETLMRFVFWLPRYRTCNFIKACFLRIMGAKVGKRVVFYPGLWIISGKLLVLGDDVDLAKDVLITTDGGVSIGDRTLIGYRTQILSSNHTIPPIGERFPISGDKYDRIIIENDVWIAAGCIITAGVHIGEGAVVAAGAVVTHDVEANTIVGGVPARVIGRRRTDQ